MSDFDLLKTLQKELIDTLQERMNTHGWLPRSCCAAKIRRLRLQIQEVMLRLERDCNCAYKNMVEKWEKGKG